MEIVKLKSNRFEYNAELAAKQSMSVAELIAHLENLPQNAKVIFSNDNGYTYGYVNENYISVGKQ